MSKLSLESNINTVQSENIQQKIEKTPKEWKPTVRIQKREEKLRTKLRIDDLYPDRQYVKESTDNESRYFLLIILPVAISALYSSIQRDELYEKFVNFLVTVLGGG